MRSKTTNWLIVFVLVAVCGYNIASPYLAAYRLSQAIKSQDVATLNELVDYETLRENLKSHLRAKLARGLESNPSLQNDIFVDLGLAVGGMVTDQLVNSYLSPEALLSIMNGRSAPGLGSNAGVSQTPYTTDASVQQTKPKRRLNMGYLSPNSFFVDVIHNSSMHHPRFILSRAGWFTWKLSDIQVVSDVGISDDSSDQ
jgi:Protein of unknown function (DUF2939)